MQSIAESSVRSWSKHGYGRAPNAVSAVCPYCGAKVVFSLAEHKDDVVHLSVAATAKCPGCDGKVLFWAIRHEQSPKSDENNPAAVYMYPPAKNYYPAPEFASDIPDALQRSFVSTIDAFNSGNYAATAVCCRRTLEGIFKYLLPPDKSQGTLAHLIDQAKAELDLAAPLSVLSHAIRDGGNLGAHFDMQTEPTGELARQMVELLSYLISYLYVLPKEIQKLEQSLGRDA